MLTVTHPNSSIDSGFINGKGPFVLQADDSLLTATFYFDQKEVGEAESVTLCGKIPTNS